MLLDKPLAALTAEDLMSTSLVMIPQEMSLQCAARLLSQANVTGAPVVSADGRCVGVLSSTDFLHWAEKGSRRAPHHGVSSSWQIVDAAELPLEEVRHYMTADPVTVTARMPVAELSRMMLDAHIHRVIVVDKNGRPIGLVSSTDILAAVAHHTAAPEARRVPARPNGLRAPPASRPRAQERSMTMSVLESPAHLHLDATTAADLMTPNPVSIQEGAALREAVVMLTEKGFSAAPVIDNAGRPVGVLSRSDILVHDREAVAYVPSGNEYFEAADLAWGFQVENVDRTTVRDMMTPAVFSVAPDAHVAKVIDEMLKLRVHRLFVVDDAGVLVGVISAFDVLRHLRP